jgi:murein DD-endopeptidase MepM/ murein hydrolase activator NlpD
MLSRMPARRRQAAIGLAVALVCLASRAALTLTLTLTPALAPAQSPTSTPIEIRVAARTIAPGELVVLTLGVDPATTRVSVRAFSRAMPVYEVRAGVWQALVGVDLDDRPGAHDAAIEATTAAGVTRATERLTVKPKAFPTRRLKVDPDFVNPPPDELTRIEREAAFIRDVSRHSPPERLWSMPFVRPVAEPANSRFGSRSVFNGEPRRPHGGADFLSAAGTPVQAPNAGRVAAARDLFFTGNTVIIDHGMGVVSLLAHLQSMAVHEGDLVSAGQVIGRVGATGRVTGPHLHWGLTVAEARVDPLSVLALIGEKTPTK